MGVFDTILKNAKTPYQFDLEVKDRKPDIVPKVGDKVKIKSKEWYDKWKDGVGKVCVKCNFVTEMAEYCGTIQTIIDITEYFYSLSGNDFYWSPEMFEEVYPQESASSSVYTVNLGGEPIRVKVSKLNAPKDSKLKMINRNQYIKLKKL